MDKKNSDLLCSVWNQLDRETSSHKNRIKNVKSLSSSRETVEKLNIGDDTSLIPDKYARSSSVHQRQHFNPRSQHKSFDHSKVQFDRNTPQEIRKAEGFTGKSSVNSRNRNVRDESPQVSNFDSQHRAVRGHGFKGSYRNQRHVSRNDKNTQEELPSFPGQAPKNTKIPRPLSYSALQDLTTKPANEILLRINSPFSPFSVLLKEKEIRVDVMALVLVALGKSCSANLNQCVGSLLSSLSNNTEFLLFAIPRYLVSIRLETMRNTHKESLLHLATLLQKFQHTLPSNSSDTISIILPHLKISTEKFLKNHMKYEEVLQMVNEIDEQNEFFKKKHTPEEIKKISNREKQHLIDPPENYRSIPVLPTPEDVQAPVTFLRCSIIEGKYSNIEHYLDVQYRLLREDYVRPLREGIADYLMLKKQGKSFKHAKDVRVHADVHIVKQDFINGGIVHIAQFSGTNFSKVNWEFSKRFLSGSLLCFSSDDFKNMLFATVALRVPEKLKNGLLLIRFEDVTDEVLNLSPLRSFVVIETTAYFEAYRYNLQALCELNAGNLPFQRYIVDVENIVQKPKYLDESLIYDFRPLLLPLNDKHIIHQIDLDGNVEVKYEFPESISKSARAVRVMENSSWPSEADLNLDHSQFNALKAAVTKEFTIIQGPPGTGKTYIGLRIVQLLLHNLNSWFSRWTHSLPILVVCYTNHALDQFLEGLMLFTKQIVRIGGRGNNQAVAQYQLSNLKKLAASKKEIPKYISASMWEKGNEIRRIQHQLDEINKSINKSSATVLGEYEIESAMPVNHFLSLKSIKNTPYFKENGLSDDGHIIHDWLGVRSRADDLQEIVDSLTQDLTLTYADVDKSKAVSDSRPVPELEDEVESGGEADVEFIEAQRDIDRDEYALVSFDIDVPEEELHVPVDSGWKTQGGKKARSKYIKKNLLNSVAYDESEAMKIKNIWKLSIFQRWRLYRFWLEKYIAMKQVECMKYQHELKVQHQEMCEMRTEGDIFILSKAHIVGMTTTGAAKYRHLVLRLKPQILVVEEAAEILESHIVTSLAPNTQHVILIGDHQQLRPSPTVYALAVNYGLEISLFERMIKNKMECFKLSIQHRMRPEIAELIVPSIYPDLENHKSVTKFENIRGVGKNVFFVNHNHNELQESDSKSKVNAHEATFLIQLCRYFVLQGYDPSQITVLTTYSGQLFAMKKLVKDVMRKVRITVVDNYQGEENDIILISFVRSNEDGVIGFLKISNRVCVALSRARKGLFCIGNFGLLAEKSHLWKSIVSTLVKNNAIGSSLQLVCENHPGVYSIVANEKEFENVAEGGCSRMCEYRLSCGHVCSLMCHPYDKLHEDIRCFKSCNNTCEKGHQCKKKCYEECGSCTHKVDKYLSDCGHTIKVPCSSEFKDTECTAPCDLLLPCKHRCLNLCGKPCTKNCQKKVSGSCPVGHDITVECMFVKDPIKLMEYCSHPCNAILSCGHLCSGSCAQCFQGRLHVSCNKPCKRILVCGHECKSSCSKSCPPCKLPCENRCFHSKCPKYCGEPCDICKEPCEYACVHVSCSNLCGELCDRGSCNKPCLKLLPCKHPCIGFCGELCPDVCRICDSDIVQDIFFGSEDDEDSRFVQLEDCKHVLEISGLTHWMESSPEGDTQVQLKACPKCKTQIRRNLRFGNIVKNSLKQIEKVKNLTYGGHEKNSKAMKTLLLQVRQSKATFLKLNKVILYETWVKVLSSKKSRNIQQITTMENIFQALTSFSNCVISVDPFSFYHTNKYIKVEIENLCKFMHCSLKYVLNFIQDEYLTASEQQLEQLTWEIHRYKLSSKLLYFVQANSIKTNDSDFEKCIELLTKFQPFSEKYSTEFCSVFQNFAKQYNGSAIINLSDLEKKSILKAMGLSQGHWYQCPNGHVYCITECGGAMQESKCNECNETIGGHNHTLLSTNRVATAMDGATYAAWSEAANMGNYDF